MTKLETAVYASANGALLRDASSREEKQSILDDIAPSVLHWLDPADIIEHSREVYNATADEYAGNPHTKDIIDELIQFMSMLPNGARVLDVGCGPGRDSLFMSYSDEGFRNEYMGRMKAGKPTHERFSIPQKTFAVIGIDISEKMITLAKMRMVELIEQGFVSGHAQPVFYQADMHDFHDHEMPFCNYFDGIWSCTALFTHTPKELLQSTMKSVVFALKPNGLFFTGYTNGAITGQYDKLLISSTGRIKYFSQPDPQEITRIAQEYGMMLENQISSDFEVGGKIVQKDLFVSQFFRKM